MAVHSISAVGLSKRYRSDAGADGWLDAVKDMSFDIAAGEGVGIIGRNGAGKSTLLRILSRVTRPTSGYADVYGRVGAMLEVGTGFHPELTGRENTYLSGAMLGMSRGDVQRRFDEIVAFSEIEAFIDTPVKRYSSGMFARLGFAVAAHLLPDILIVDEVLAVGDLPFQAKCLARMHRLTEDGITVLFVSHNLLAVADLCSRALLLQAGSLTFDGRADEAIKRYRASLGASLDGRSRDEQPAPTGLRVLVDGSPPAEPVLIAPNSDLRVDVELDRAASQAEVQVALNLLIERPDGLPAVHLRSDLTDARLALGPGTNRFTIWIDDLSLAPGTYAMWLRLAAINVSDPVLLDSERIPVEVVGDQRLDALVMPRHRFTQRVESPLQVGAER